MATPTLVFLPGLHGTDDLVGHFLDAVPDEIPRRVITYPLRETLDYADLLQRIAQQLAEETQMVLIGESFSGPLAVMFAAAHPDRVAAVALIASFVRHPLPSWGCLIVPIACRLPLPARMIRWLLAGSRASDELVRQVRRAIRRPATRVMSHRLQCAFTVDCSDQLPKVRAPILYLLPTRDHLVGPWAIAHIRAIRPDVEVISIPGPHLILETAPAAAWEAICRFWK